MRSVGLLLLPGFQLLGLSTLTPFEVANLITGERCYDLTVVSETGGLVPSSIGTKVETRAVGDHGFDTLLVSVGSDLPEPSHGVLTYLGRSLRTTHRLASVCLASFVFGEAGLLDGRRATTHWHYASLFRARFPSCVVDIDKIFVEDGPVWTSAGMTAATDLAIGMIERDHGADLARQVARSMVMHHRRSGGQSQHSTLLDLDSPNDRVQTVLAYARRNLRRPLDTTDLARVARLSPRQFTRLFRAETGTTPAKAIEALRLEVARFMLGQSRLPVEEVAREAGFGNRERMRRAFSRTHGEVPRSIRGIAGPVATMEAR